MMATLIDVHCHLDRYEDEAAVLQRARDAGVFINYVTFLPSDFVRYREQYRDTPGIEVGIGFHPMASLGRFPWTDQLDLHREMEIFGEYSDRSRWIGEVGLDFTVDGVPFQRMQRRMIEAVLDAPTVSGKFLTVHSRAAEYEMVDRLVAAGVKRAAFHGNGFTGELAELEYVLDAGFAFSVVSSMFYDDERRAIVEAIPRDRVIAESDAPFGIVDGRALEPHEVVLVRSELAGMWGMDEASVGRILADNTARLLTG